MRFEPRKPTRLKHYDYSEPGAYFFTICTHHFIQFFGKIRAGQMHSGSYGDAVREVWASLPSHFRNLELDEFVVMPNHLHGILTLKPVAREYRRSCSQILASLISFSTREINKIRQKSTPPIWQRSFRDRVVRPEEDINDYRQYIIDNPAQWELDEFNRRRRGQSKTGPGDR